MALTPTETLTMKIDNILVLIVMGSAMIYLALGILNTRTLLTHSRWFARHSRNNDLLCILSTLAWPPIFILIITWRTFEMLIAPHKKDLRGGRE
jgi:hypothetical protein